jgi:exopolyphosphatase/guanosine-5'-triphosphate,3'-diphosphate pyrophosphatase
MRVASIDIGTNTLLLLIADSPTGRPDDLVALVEFARIVRLGEDVDRTRVFKPEAVARTLLALDEAAALVCAHGVTSVDVVGTSAMRDAVGADPIVAFVRERLGAELRVISGEEEARLTFDGALAGLNVRGRVAVFDIGGGSTEIVHGEVSDGAATIVHAQSYDIGSVRLTERCVRHDPPTPSELRDVEAAVDEALRDAPQYPAQTVVGIAGTVTTLAAVSLRMSRYDAGRIHGYLMSTDILRHVTPMLSVMTTAQRSEVAGLDPKRADVIVAGGLIAEGVLHHLSAREMLVSDRGVRWGLVRQRCQEISRSAK